MLALDSTVWNDLTHAYGRAGDIPDLLRVLADEDDDHDAAWQALWGALCHQGSPSPAAYAAVPHLIAIAATMPADERIEHVRFAGAIAAAEAEVPPALDAAYRGALATAQRMVDEVLATQPSVNDAAWLLWAALALHGAQEAARALECFADGGTIVTRCPAEPCGASLELNRQGTGWSELALAGARGAPTTPIAWPRTREVDAAWSDRSAPARMAALAEQHGYETLAAKLDLLRGTATCPKCHDSFLLWPEILAPSDL